MPSGCPFPEHHQSGGGGGGLLPVIALLVVIGLVAGPIVRAVTDLIEVLAVLVAVLLAAAGAVALIVWRVRRRYGLPARPVVLTARQIPPEAGRRRVGPEVAGRRAAGAIESPRDDTPTYPRVYADPYVVTSRNARQRCTRRHGRRS
jgi:hypothetical protein